MPKNDRISANIDSIQPDYDLAKLKFGNDSGIFERAAGIYNTGGVVDFIDDYFGFAAKVRGSRGNYYNVSVSRRDHGRGGCTCYMGQNGELCKHMLALAIYAVKRGEPLNEEEMAPAGAAKCSGRLGGLNRAELTEIKAVLTSNLRFIKRYNGPSRIWFAYQDSLSEGCNRLAALVSDLPVSLQTAELLVDLLLRLDRKLGNAVDDSDGTVGGFIEDVVCVLQDFAKRDRETIKAFKRLRGRNTIFDWEDPLLELVDEK